MRYLVGLFAIFLVVLGFTVPASATILTFEIRAGVGHGYPVPNTYGDNVTSTNSSAYWYKKGNAWTPHVDLTYAPLANNNKVAWRDNNAFAGWKDTDGASMPYGDIGQTSTYTFKPTAGVSVAINSWLLGNLTDGTTVINWAIYKNYINPVNLLDSGSKTVSSNAVYTITPNMQPYGGTVILAFTNGGGVFWDRVIDDINFDEFKVGDFNNDNIVDGTDYFIWMTHYPMASGAVPADGDADQDGDVDDLDFLLWQYRYYENFKEQR